MRTTRSPRRALLAVVAALALLTASCSDDGGEASQPAGDGATGGALPECPVGALDDADGPVEVVAWHTQTARPLATLEQLTEEYNASQSAVRVRLESQGASYAEIQRKFNQAVASRDLPALIMVDDTFTRSMADSGVALPAEACFEASGDDLDDLVDTARSYYTIDGVLWPASAGLGNVLLYINRNHFARAGLDPDQPPSTLDELRAAAEAIRDAGVADAPFVHELSSWKTEFWLTGAGSPVVDNDNGRGDGTTSESTLADNPEALALLEWMAEMRADGLLQAVPATPGQIDQYIAMATQSASMLVDTTSAATSIEAFLGGELDAEDLDADADVDVDLSQLDLGAAPFPGLGEGGRTQMGGAAWYLLDSGDDAVTAAAWDYMRFLNSPEAQAQMLVGGSYLPWVSAAVDEPDVQSYFAGEGGLAGQWLAMAQEAVEEIDLDFPGPLIGPYDQFREIVQRAQDDVVFGGVDPAAALDRAQSQVDAALERYEEENF